MAHKEAPAGVGFGEKMIIAIVLLGVLLFIFYPMLQGRVNEGDLLSAGNMGLFIWQYRIGPILAFLDVLLFVLFIYSMVRAYGVYPHVSVFEAPTVMRGKRRLKRDPVVLKHWANIVKRANSGTTENLRLAILEADALVDYFLKRNGFQGDHMADRLSVISPDEVKSLENLWKAHRLRNELAHTPGFVVAPLEAKEALLAFREFLIELGAF